MAFRTSLSGLEAASTDLSVTGNNIANASTNGFKQSRTEFADIFATSFSGTSGTTPGSGVRVASVAQQFAQGNVEFTSSSLDLAINEEGFFVLDDNGSQAYTRAGAFTTDKDGFVVDSSGRQLQIFPANANGTFSTGSLTSLQLVTSDSAPKVTTTVTPVLNLDAKQEIPPIAPFDPTNANTFNHSTSTTVYDSLGNPYTSTMYYVASDPANNDWDVYTYVDGQQLEVSGEDHFTLGFNGDGSFQDITVGANPPTTGAVAFDPLTIIGQGSNPLTLSFDYSNSTQYGSDFAVNSLNQDGFASGRLSGINIDPTGAVFATFTNGQSSVLGQVALANFPNNNGLQQLGNTSWGETFAAGDRVLGAAGTAGFGSIQSGALEASNVDIATQLVNLITAQRNFQANAQAITTENEIQTTIINIR